MAEPSSPPVYGSDIRDNTTAPHADLPAYTGRTSPPPPTATVRRHPLIEHVFELTNKGTPWATLKLQSGAKCASQLPSFVEGEDITGSIDLNLENWETVHSIAISVKGQIITAADPNGCYVFLDRVQTLWSKSMGDPRQLESASGHDKFNGKLRGTYSWPFVFRLPAEVSISRESAPQTYRLPQTFRERLTRPSVQYELIVRICRGRLRTNSYIQTTLVYIPRTKPDPPSPLRQLAYQENSPLLGPEADPNGWKSTPFRIRGTIFNARFVEANCALSLATPLCYTRGAAIPCVLSLETPDSQAMDLLSSARAIDVRLRRCVRYRENAGASTKAGRGWNEDVEDMGTAVWWPSQEGGTFESGQRKLDGEIHLSKGLKPTSAMVHFTVEYAVIILPFEPPAFTSADTDILVRERVEIATMYACGPRPKTYSPPSYETSSRSSLGAGVFQTYTDAMAN